jgi:hypothetical protein
MPLIQESQRQDASKSLNTLQVQGLNNINALSSVLSNLEALKTKTINEQIFDESDTGDVQSVIDNLKTQISAI